MAIVAARSDTLIILHIYKQLLPWRGHPHIVLLSPDAAVAAQWGNEHTGIYASQFFEYWAYNKTVAF